MNGADDDEVVAPCNRSQVVDDLPAGNRVQPAGRLVEKQDLGTRNELAGNSNAALLTTGDALAQRGADEGAGLGNETERAEQAVNAELSLMP